MQVLPNWYIERREFIQSEIDSYLDLYLSNISNLGLEVFSEATKYASTGGKKLRAILTLEFFLCLNEISFEEFYKNKAQYGDIIKLCLAIEFVHAYSLVHDDLPCMDNDELRRGQPTVWKKYGEYQAVLVGDLLNSLSFEILSEIQDTQLSAKLSNLLSKSIGFHGMLGGQVDDMYFEASPDEVSLKNLVDLHNKKTGALIKTAVQGGILVSGKLEYLHKLSGFGEKIGLAFQIKDDLLDAEGTAEETGKSVGGEEKGFVYLIGLQKTKEKLSELITECNSLIKPLDSEHISFLVQYIESRKK